MKKRCHDYPIGQPFGPDICLVCWLYANNQVHAAAMDAPKTERPPCIHFGDPNGHRESCGGCGQDTHGKPKTRLTLFVCAIHHECAPATKLDGVMCCRECSDYRPAPVP